MLANIKITTRITLGFAALLLLLIMLALGGAWGEREINQHLQAMDKDVDAALRADQISITMLQLRRFEKDMMLNLGNPGKVAEYEKNGRRAVKQCNACCKVPGSRQTMPSDHSWRRSSSCTRLIAMVLARWPRLPVRAPTRVPPR